MSESTLEYYATHPLVAVTAAFGLLFKGLGWIAGVLQVLGSLAGSWTPLLGMAATLGSMTSIVPAAPTRLLLVGGLSFALLYKGEQFIDRFSAALGKFRP